MARIGRIRAASGASGRYGATRQHSRDDDVFESSFRSIDTLRSQDDDDDLSCTDCCKAGNCVCVSVTVRVCVGGGGGGGLKYNA